MDNGGGSGRKVGIVFNSVEGGYCRIDIYLVDVDDYECFGGLVWSYPPIEPTIKFQYPLCVGYVINVKAPAVCLVNSNSTTLYMFDSNYPDPDDHRIPFSKSAYKFDLSQIPIPAPSRMTMNHFKYITKALPLPDGHKIIVFSSRFFFKDSGSAFELFDFTDASFHKIPPFPSMHHDCRCRYCTGESDRLVTVDAYSLIGKSHFLVQLPMVAYALDLEGRTWTLLHIATLPLQDSECGEYDVSFMGYFQTFMDRYAFLPLKVPYSYLSRRQISRAHRRAKVDHKVVLNLHDVGNFFRQDARERDCCVRSYQLSSLTPPYHEQSVSISVVPMKEEEEEESKVASSCIVQLHFDLWSETARILIDFCCTDVTTRETTISKSASLTVTNYTWLPNDITYFIL